MNRSRTFSAYFFVMAGYLASTAPLAAMRRSDTKQKLAHLLYAENFVQSPRHLHRIFPANQEVCETPSAPSDRSDLATDNPDATVAEHSGKGTVPAQRSDAPTVKSLHSILTQRSVHLTDDITVRQEEVPDQGDDGSCGYHALYNALTLMSSGHQPESHSAEESTQKWRKLITTVRQPAAFKALLRQKFQPIREHFVDAVEGTDLGAPCSQVINAAIEQCINALSQQLGHHTITIPASLIRYACLREITAASGSKVRIPTISLIPPQLHSATTDHLNSCACDLNITIPHVSSLNQMLPRHSDWLASDELQLLIAQERTANPSLSPSTSVITVIPQFESLTSDSPQVEDLRKIRKELLSGKPSSHAVIVGTMTSESASGHWLALVIKQIEDASSHSGVRREYILADSQATKLRLYAQEVKALIFSLEANEKCFSNLNPSPHELQAIERELENLSNLKHPTLADITHANELCEAYTDATGDKHYYSAVEALGSRLAD